MSQTAAVHIRREAQRDLSESRLEVWLLVAQLVNDLGSGVTSIALPLLVYSRTASVAATSLVYVANAVPVILLSLVGGAHADRVDRKSLVVTLTLLVGAVLCLLPSLYTAGGLAAIISVAFVARCLLSFSNPAFRAALPKLMGEKFQDYTGKRTGLSFLAQAAGPAIGGALVGLVGAPNAVYADGASYLLFALVVASIHGFDADAQTRRVRARDSSTVRSIGEGLTHLRHNDGARSLYLYWFLSLSALPISLLAAVPYLRTELHASSFEYGIAVACYAIASLVGSYLAGKYNFHGGARRWLLLSGVGYGLANLLMLTHPDYIAFCVLWVLWGVAYGPEEVVGQVAFAQLVSEELQGRMYAVMNLVFSMAALVGAAAVGPLADSLGAQGAMVTAGFVFIAATLASFVAGPGARALRSVDLQQATGRT